MAQNTTGWRRLLSIAGSYSLCKKLLGNARSRQEFIEKYIRPEKGMRILDLGCGPATILEYLPRDIDYVGVDLSREYIDAARKKYGERGEFHCKPIESLFDERYEGFDMVMGLGVLHHLDDIQARSFFSIAAKALKYNGRCLTLDCCLHPGQHLIAQLLIRMDRGQNVRTKEGYAALAKTFFPCLIQEVHHDRMRFPYTHHIMACKKS